MKTSVTIRNDVDGLILSLGTGYNGRNEEYRCLKIESVVSKGGYVVSVGLKSKSLMMVPHIIAIVSISHWQLFLKNQLVRLVNGKSN